MCSAEDIKWNFFDTIQYWRIKRKIRKAIVHCQNCTYYNYYKLRILVKKRLESEGYDILGPCPYDINDFDVSITW